MSGREEALSFAAAQRFDLCVVGAGASGAATALESQRRGMRTALVDAGDICGATSSASSKLAHGGVRYLEQAVRELDAGQYRVVRRALRERKRMIERAPCLAHRLELLAPCMGWFDAAYYLAGMKIYDWLSGPEALAPSSFLGRKETLRRMPRLRSKGLAGAVRYADGQFDDARYGLAMVRSFAAAGGVALNYARVTGFEKDRDGRLAAARVEDAQEGRQFEIAARAFVNATGPFSDALRAMAAPGISPRLRLSKGAHLLLPLSVLESADALLVPRTEDGRVLFLIPWLGRLLVGTTEREVAPGEEMILRREETEYLLGYVRRYLTSSVKPCDVVSGFAGMRPLVIAGGGRETKRLIRDHEVECEPSSGLVSLLGGKWTTHRAMAEDTVDAIQRQLGLAAKAAPDGPLDGAAGCGEELRNRLEREYGISAEAARHLSGKYGSNADAVLALAGEEPELGAPLVDGFPALQAEIVYAVRQEMALRLEDVLARRIGLEFYSWKMAWQAAPVAAKWMARELGWSLAESRNAAQAYAARIERLMRMAGVEDDSASAPVQ